MMMTLGEARKVNAKPSMSLQRTAASGIQRKAIGENLIFSSAFVPQIKEAPAKPQAMNPCRQINLGVSSVRPAL